LLILRVYLSSPVLKTGLILADLPGSVARSRRSRSNVMSGLQDTNLARVRATQNYLLTCDHIFVVANISRAITDQSLKSSLYHVLANHVPTEWETSAGRYLNVAVVCTRIEVRILTPNLLMLTLKGYQRRSVEEKVLRSWEQD
jgi:hypothetical protein